ncbi:hypothetical protein ACXJY6_11710 [Vibrio sp. RC27]
MKILNIAGLLVTILSGILAIGGGQLLFKNGKEKYKEEKQSTATHTYLNKVSEEINKSLPLMLDSNVRLEKVTNVDNTLVYKITIVDVEVEQVDKKKLHELMSKKLSQGYCFSDDMKLFREQKIPLIYSYFDKVGEQILYIALNTDICD